MSFHKLLDTYQLEIKKLRTMNHTNPIEKVRAQVALVKSIRLELDEMADD